MVAICSYMISKEFEALFMTLLHSYMYVHVAMYECMYIQVIKSVVIWKFIADEINIKW